MRVPEAYLLLRPFETTRPGLLVLDADARRIDSIPLSGAPHAGEVARRLAQARDKAPRERVLLRIHERAPGDVVVRLGALEGGEPPKLLPGGFVEVWGRKGAVSPGHVAAIAAEAKTEIAIVDPVPVALAAARQGVALDEAIDGVAGVRHVTTANGVTTAWISRWLLHPRHLHTRGLSGDVAAVTFAFENLPDGVAVVKHLRRPFAEKGVLAVIPHVRDGAIEVIVRPALHDAEATRAALVEGGLTTKP